ncbi:BA14K family protein [Mesorhizobium sp. ES1-4]|uniref:BA14K family protein n=1 Tax=Mesorhizobium sp. ES1-4 TaxID=2876627 RepID=UPI001CCE1916|nr:BA14K family protein [Mesorhizobium sp. ES1-4]MBZ9797640.1 BA14K family protein [Mesorhizobium sp. ES1-4]
MKAILALVCGFVLTLAVFGSGLGFAFWVLAAKSPHEARPTVSVAELWTRNARPVDKAAQNLQRLPADQPAPSDVAVKEPAPDTTATGSIAPAAAADALPASHVRWCADHYRSCHPDDNSYMSYSGQLRPCVSPYLDAGADQGTQPAAAVSYVAAGDAASAATTALSADHIDSCFSRYRSYRPDDNSYQPYSGGPRRQCE